MRNPQKTTVKNRRADKRTSAALNETFISGKILHYQWRAKYMSDMSGQLYALDSAFCDVYSWIVSRHNGRHYSLPVRHTNNVKTDIRAILIGCISSKFCESIKKRSIWKLPNRIISFKSTQTHHRSWWISEPIKKTAGCYGWVVEW